MDGSSGRGAVSLSATVRDVAKKAGVSPSTVSRVLSGAVPVREELRARVMGAVAELHYQYRPLGASPSGAASIGIIVPKSSGSDFLAHPTIYSIFSAFVDELSNRGIGNSVLLVDKEHLSHIETLFGPRHDGYLIIGTNEEEEDRLMPYLLENGIPHMIVNRWMNEKYMNYINVDDVTASYGATQHLISLGHRDIAFIGGNRNFRNTSLRLIGYKNAMAEAGLPVPPAYIHYGLYTEAFGYEVADAVLSLPARPTAAFFCSDMIAIGFQKRCRERGIPLPSGLAMVGYGNTPLASYVRPPLTTVEMPAEVMGRQAAHALLNLVENPAVARVQILLKAPLIIRESCGAPLMRPQGT